jgi:dinuclear metal center YbgI/SA1388 family protein
MTTGDIVKVLEEFAPLRLQEDYDNAGLILGNRDDEIDKALLCLDVTESVLDEAIRKGCGLIISHHPLLLRGIKKITGENPVERLLLKAIKNDLSLYAVHTNIDSIIHGVNGYLARILGLNDIAILLPKHGLLKKLVTFCPVDKAEQVRKALFEAGGGYIGNYDSCSYNVIGQGSFRPLENAHPYVGEIGKIHFEEEVRVETIFPAFAEQKIVKALLESHPYEEVAYDIYRLDNEYNKAGSGMTGILPDEMDEKDFLNFIKFKINIPCIRHSGFIGKKIKKVALCGGSGKDLIHDAIVSGSDAFLTSDMKYHDFSESDGKLLLADIGHYESEQFTKELLYSVLSEKFPTFAFLVTSENTNYIHYFI